MSIVQSTDKSEPKPLAPYVRLAKLSEFETVSRLISRFFANERVTSWLGSVKRSIDLEKIASGKALKGELKQLELIYYFYNSLIHAIHLTGGHVVVVAVPDPENMESEKLVACSAWIAPGSSMDSLYIILRTGQHRTVLGTWQYPYGWGLTGLKRSLIDWQSRVDKLHKTWCKENSVDIKAAWRMQVMGTEPSEEGKGYCSMLLKDADNRYGHIPMYAEATSPKSRDIYHSKGWKIISNPRFGVDVVTEYGLPSEDKQKRIGVPVWLMFKLPQ